MNVDGATDRLRQICRLYLEPLEGSFFVELGILPFQSAENPTAIGRSLVRLVAPSRLKTLSAKDTQSILDTSQRLVILSPTRIISRGEAIDEIG